MSTQIYNVVDTGALGSLVQTDNLNALFAGDRKVVITQQVREEILRPDTSGNLRANQVKVQNWLDDPANSNRIFQPDVEVGLDTQKGFHPNSPRWSGFVNPTDSSGKRSPYNDANI